MGLLVASDVCDTDVLDCLGGAVFLIGTVVCLSGRDSLFNVKSLEIVWLVARVNCAVYDFPEDSQRRLEPVDVSSGLLKAV